MIVNIGNVLTFVEDSKVDPLYSGLRDRIAVSLLIWIPLSNL